MTYSLVRSPLAIVFRCACMSGSSLRLMGDCALQKLALKQGLEFNRLSVLKPVTQKCGIISIDKTYQSGDFNGRYFDL